MKSTRSRGRSKNNRNRQQHGGNIINRVFDSSGPEGKVRGTPQQVIEKYNQLARDATLSNDRVAAENFQQHAEHYLRMLAAAQKEVDQRREEQERQNRERQAERDRERAERQEREAANAQQSNASQNAGQPNTEQPNAAQPDAAVAEGAPQPDVTEASEHGLVETPESKPKPKRQPRRKPKPKVEDAPAEGAAQPEVADKPAEI